VSKSAPKFALAVVAATLAWGCSQQPAAPPAPAAGSAGESKSVPPVPIPGGDDRPPIIIGDGSLDMYIDPYYGTTGSWLDKKPADHTIWVHKGDPNYPIQHFDLTLINPKKNGNGACQLSGYSTKELTLEYTGGGPKHTVKITIDPVTGGGDLQAVLEEPAKQDSDYPFWLFVEDDKIKLQSVTFLDKGTTSTFCSFTGNHRGSVTIHQSKDALPPMPMKKD
jgi:hypothetical protein